MPSLFSKIIAGEIPCYKVAETKNCIAFLDVFPLEEGHVLVVPKKEIDYIFDIDDELYKGLFVFAKQVAVKLKKAIPCAKVGVMVAGLEVPHAHIHLIPFNGLNELTFARAKAMDNAELAQIAQKIRGV